MRRIVRNPAVWLLAALFTAAAPGQVIFDMETPQFRVGEITKDNKKIPAGSAEPVDGKFGKAVKFSFIEGAQGGWMSARAPADASWDAADGFSFWVKGDGSANFGGIEMIDRDDFGLRYAYCFPIDSTEWKKITVRWGEMIPELAGPLVNVHAPPRKEGYSPNRFGNFWFGKWFYWRDYPAESFSIDQVALEPKIDPPLQNASRVITPGLQRIAKKLKEGKPITIVTMGDSLTDEHHWSNREKVWHGLLAKRLT